jgi:hypothetical protein
MFHAGIMVIQILTKENIVYTVPITDKKNERKIYCTTEENNYQNIIRSNKIFTAYQDLRNSVACLGIIFIIAIHPLNCIYQILTESNNYGGITVELGTAIISGMLGFLGAIIGAYIGKKATQKALENQRLNDELKQRHAIMAYLKMSITCYINFIKGRNIAIDYLYVNQEIFTSVSLSGFDDKEETSVYEWLFFIIQLKAVYAQNGSIRFEEFLKTPFMCSDQNRENVKNMQNIVKKYEQKSDI